MDIHTNIPLKNYVTMKIGGPARFMAEIYEASEVAELYKRAAEQKLSVFILGGGSNIVVPDKGYAGIVARVRIAGFEMVSDDLNSTTLKIGAGEIWDSVVQRSVEAGLSGVEAMSGIPGTSGAMPVQNSGAYGQEIADVLVSLEAYDTQNDIFVTLSNSDCNFSYRDSAFKNEFKGRYVVTHITIKLSKNAPKQPFYASLQNYFDSKHITIFTADVVRRAVLELRSVKVPDPSISPSCGSFFKNVIVESWQLDDLRAIASDIPLNDMGDGRFKIPAGWLIEFVGLKGKLLHGIRVYDKNALLLINESASGYSDLVAARDEIIDTVRDTFHLQIEQEPIEMI